MMIELMSGMQVRVTLFLAGFFAFFSCLKIVKAKNKRELEVKQILNEFKSLFSVD